ncbi:MAG: anti-sigma factor antagonist [Nocardioides sp.]|nr:anti-sigma factor antagonist [Nocardioides sp.]
MTGARYAPRVIGRPFVAELDEERHLLRLAGELIDQTAVAALHVAIGDATAAYSRPLAIDLSEVDFMPSAAVGVLGVAIQRASNAGHPIRLIATDGSVAQRMLAVCAFPYATA